MSWTRLSIVPTLVFVLVAIPLVAAENDKPPLQPLDVFDLEWASDPRISPDGSRIVYVRNFMDIMADRERSNLWTVSVDGSDHRPLTSGLANHASPRWSPDGGRLLYVARTEHGAQLFVRWMDTGQTAQITRLTRSPGNVRWSPDGRWIAFTMLVPDEEEPLAELPAKPDGATWAEPPKVIDRLIYRFDGAGYLEEGHDHLFVVPAEGGTPRQLTEGPYDHDGRPAWTPDGKAIVFSANRHENAELDPLNSELYRVRLADGTIEPLTDRQGPDGSPAISPDGTRIAYVGFDDRYQGYQLNRLYLLERDGGEPRLLTGDLDRDVEDPTWSPDGRGVFFLYDDHGRGKIGFASLDGRVRTVAEDVHGLSLGRPYTGGDFTVGAGGRVAYTLGGADHPADVATATDGQSSRRLTDLNADLFAARSLATVEPIRFESSFDGRPIEGWVVKPPDFDAKRKYPLILEIHGGPFAAYGPVFSTEIQLYAAAGYVVLYVNPRGSSSYGEEFGNLIHHAYPGNDYDDLMSGIDALLERGGVDPERLYVTGGSGGGVLSAWIVGKTDRFRAAVVAKPVIDWASFALTADAYNFFHKYWFDDYPWENPIAYWERSPLSLVGEVDTPTMLLTGEMDFRTPISQSEEFYQALKLRQVEAALVRIPGASHHIAGRPSQLIAKVQHVLAWFDRHGGAEE